MSQFSFEQKIEILSKMALDYCNENGLKFKQYNQKFAELIVRECINEIHVADVGDLKAKDYYLDKVAEHIEQHFGVDE